MYLMVPITSKIRKFFKMPIYTYIEREEGVYVWACCHNPRLRFQFYTNGNSKFWETHSEDAREHISNDPDKYHLDSWALALWREGYTSSSGFIHGTNRYA